MPEDCFVNFLHIILDHQRGTLNRGLKLAIVMHEDPQELILHEHTDPSLIDLQDGVRVQHLKERHHVLDHLPAGIGCQPVVLSHLGHLVLGQVELIWFLMLVKQVLDTLVDSLQHGVILAICDHFFGLLLVLLMHGLGLIKYCRRVLQVHQYFLIDSLELSEHLLNLEQGVKYRGVDVGLVLLN